MLVSLSFLCFEVPGGSNSNLLGSTVSPKRVFHRLQHTMTVIVLEGLLKRAAIYYTS